MNDDDHQSTNKHWLLRQLLLNVDHRLIMYSNRLIYREFQELIQHFYVSDKRLKGKCIGPEHVDEFFRINL
jgi:hypothetical protein